MRHKRPTIASLLLMFSTTIGWTAAEEIPTTLAEGFSMSELNSSVKALNEALTKRTEPAFSTSPPDNKGFVYVLPNDPRMNVWSFPKHAVTPPQLGEYTKNYYVIPPANCAIAETLGKKVEELENKVKNLTKLKKTYEEYVANLKSQIAELTMTAENNDG